MKTIRSISTAILLLAVMFLAVAKGSDPIVHIPDAAFKGCLLALKHADGSKVDANNDGEIQESEAEAFTGQIRCYGTGITDATGLEAFVNITELVFDDTNLSVLDVSSNTKLDSLKVWRGSLSTLDLSSNTDLKKLSITNISGFSALNVSNNTDLKELVCTNGKLTTLDISNNVNLEKLNVSDNNLSALDVSNNVALKDLRCGINKLTSLDVGGNTDLKELYCDGNQLTSLNVGGLADLKELGCQNNKLLTLDVSNNTNLKTLSCGNNQLADLDLSANINLESLNCSGNQFTTLDVSNTNLKRITCSNSPKLTAFYANNCPNLEYVYCNSNSNLTTLEATNNPHLTALRCFGNKLAHLDVSGCTNLENLDCNRNQIDALDISDCPNLKYLRFDNNKITQIDVSGCANLEELLCYNNKITQLDVSNNPKLWEILGERNQFTTLDFSNNSALKSLRIHDNQLTSLNVSNNPKLEKLECQGNDLIALDVSSNAKLEKLWCQDNKLTSLVLNNPKLQTLYCQNNQLTALDASGSTVLESLYCFGNQLTSLDVNSAKLQFLYCENNKLPDLDVSNVPNVEFFNCENNQLTSLDVSNNPKLQMFNCFGNQLKALDVSNNPKLQTFTCNDNLLTSLNLKNGKNTSLSAIDLKNNNDLRCIQVDDAAYSNANWSDKKDVAACFSESECVAPTFAQFPPICSGDALTLPTISEDQTPISGTWSPAIDNQQTTTYTFTPDGCNRSVTMEVVVNPKPTVTLVSDRTTICAGETVTLTATGGMGTITYAWDNGLGNGETKAVSPTTTTTYQVTGTNAEGCTDTKTLEITVNPKPIVTLVSDAKNNTICFGESVVLTAGGADTYSWDNALGSGDAKTVSPTATTVYTVTGTANGCTDVKSVTVTVKPNPVVTLNASQTTICFGESVTLTASGADTYSWTGLTGNGNEQILTPTVGTHVYKVVGTSVDGCVSEEKEVAVVANPKPVVTLTSDQKTICFGESVTLTASGADTYSWTGLTGNGNEQTLAPTVGTHVYKVVGTSADGCVSEEKEVTVVVNAKPVLTLNASQTTICFGESVKLTASGATTYAWTGIGTSGNGNEQALTPTVGTHVYKVVGTSADGCVSEEKEVAVVANAKPVVTLNANNNTICFGESAVLTAGGADTYAWDKSLGSGGAKMVSPTSTTTYTVTGTANGCTDSQSVTVTVKPNPVVTLNTGQTTICFGESITLTANGADSYSWDNGLGSGSTKMVSPTTTTTYTAIGTANGCTDSQSVTITVKAKPVLTLNASQTTICAGESVVLTASGADAYAWDNGLGSGDTKTVSPVATTAYTVIGKANGCTDSQSVTVTVKPKPVLTLNVDKTILCAGEKVSLTANGGTTYAWIDNGVRLSGNGNKQTLIPAVGTNVYKVIGTSADGCVSEEKKVTVVVNPKITPKFDPIGPFDHGEGFTLPAISINGVSGSWSPAMDGTWTREYTFTPDAGQCANGAKMTVVVSPPSQESSSGGGTSITAADNAYVVTWSRDWTFVGSVLDNANYDNGLADLSKVLLKPLASSDPGLIMEPDGTIRIVPALLPGRYTYRYRVCEVAKPDNCSSEAVAVIDIRLDGLIVPNAFTPNGDGMNDTFDILGMESFDRVELLVVNCWGEEVYRSTDYRNGWNGHNLADGTYYYAVTAHKGHHAERTKGWVLLKR